MGLTIHYSLRSSTRSAKGARDLVARLRSRALDLPFERVDDVFELSDRACDYRAYDREHPQRWLLIQAGQYIDDPQLAGYSYGVPPRHVIAFSTWPGAGCEEANFGLGLYPASIEVEDPARRGRTRRIATRLAGWRWASFCKTQYAAGSECGGVRNFLRCHLSVIKMLDHAKTLGILEGVSDEGESWERRDLQALVRQVGEWNAALAGQFKEWFGPEVVSQIERFPDREHWEAKGRT